MSRNMHMWLTKASSAHLVASSSNPKRYGAWGTSFAPRHNHAGNRVSSATKGKAWKAHMPEPVPKARISNGSVEARPALCSRFRADGLDDGKGTARLIWQKWWRQMRYHRHVRGVVTMWGTRENPPVPTLKSEGFPRVTDAPLPNSRNRTPQKDIRQNGGGIRKKAWASTWQKESLLCLPG